MHSICVERTVRSRNALPVHLLQGQNHQALGHGPLRQDPHPQGPPVGGACVSRCGFVCVVRDAQVCLPISFQAAFQTETGLTRLLTCAMYVSPQLNIVSFFPPVCRGASSVVSHQLGRAVHHISVCSLRLLLVGDRLGRWRFPPTVRSCSPADTTALSACGAARKRWCSLKRSARRRWRVYSRASWTGTMLRPPGQMGLRLLRSGSRKVGEERRGETTLRCSGHQSSALHGERDCRLHGVLIYPYPAHTPTTFPRYRSIEIYPHVRILLLFLPRSLSPLGMSSFSLLLSSSQMQQRFCRLLAHDACSYLSTRRRTHPAGAEAGDEDGANGAQAQAESGPATKRSIESVKAGERLMDALELAELELKLVRADERVAAKAKRKGEPAPPARRPNPVLLNLSPLRYVLRTLQVKGERQRERGLQAQSAGEGEDTAVRRGMDAVSLSLRLIFQSGLRSHPHAARMHACLSASPLHVADTRLSDDQDARAGASAARSTVLSSGEPRQLPGEASRRRPGGRALRSVRGVPSAGAPGESRVLEAYARHSVCTAVWLLLGLIMCPWGVDVDFMCARRLCVL